MTGTSLKRSRIESVDLVRGIIMILMALDHTRDYLAIPGVNPTDLSRTTIALFFTRWITHICAPVFFLLTGVGSCLALRRKSKGELSRFLITRGLWLIFLEIVILRCLVMQFNFDYHVTMLVVIWALGWAMIALAGLIWLPAPAVAAFGLILIGLHNLFDSLSPARFGVLAPVWTVLHVPGFLLNMPGHQVFVAYPLVPWIGVTAAGFGLGNVYRWPQERRRIFLLSAGVVASACFVLLRIWNRYGDPVPWSRQPTGTLTVLSFLNTNKYPPSLLFLLMTLGPALLMLWLFDAKTPRWLRSALVYGKVPLFFYVLHFFWIHVLAVAVCFIRYGNVHWMFESNTIGDFPITAPPDWGLSLPMTYLVWLFVLVSLYPLCKWFAGLKQRRSDAWLSYL
jgi:uncharacterized membrane protein